MWISVEKKLKKTEWTTENRQHRDTGKTLDKTKTHAHTTTQDR